MGGFYANKGGGSDGAYLTNCVVRGNAAPDGGGCSYSALVRCTVSNNVATLHNGGGLYNGTSLNCAWCEDMITHNKSDPTLASVTNNCMRGRTFNPKFVANPAEGQCPFSLAKDSPCVDAGVAHPWMTGAKDILGNDRIFKATAKVDIGALESFWALGVTIIVR